ncbi:unnamed protein product [Triticum turgidum subsp. durum]|uniref:Bifunctional inhibitor/plant lipid transfer protein/seed storage helical domain-containing protein n=1 Tax=Triticum turgidum subsp. durum TaxID=4567 RepID=A0A9R1NNU0_TRITD|nr:unnamed protein product [Triticum turgidum subsp. durum]
MHEMAPSKPAAALLLALAVLLAAANTGVATPPAACCGAFKSLVDNAPICLCHGLNGDINKIMPAPMDFMRMMSLPGNCAVPLPMQTIAQCATASVPPLDPPTAPAAPSPRKKAGAHGEVGVGRCWSEFWLPEMVLVVKQHRCTHSASCSCTKGHLSEDALFLVFRHMNWNPRLIANLSCVCKWFDEVAKQVLWKEFCHARAPKMMLDLHSDGSHIVDGNWKALGKLLIYCNGCTKGGLFGNIHVPGHFVFRTRFSRTAGKSFLPLQCRMDVLYVSDPCEHLDQGEEGDLGFFRGIFKSFATSRVKKILIEKQARFHPTEVCPYCKAKLWNMLHADMMPASASARLGAYDDSVEYFVCLNGHVIGLGTLLPLSDSEEAPEE